MNRIEDSELKRQFSNCLRNHMLAQNTTAQELSKETGIKESSISAYRNATQLPGAYNLYLIATYFGITTHELLGFDDGAKNNSDEVAVANTIGLTVDAVKTLQDLKSLKNKTGYENDLEALSDFISYSNGFSIFTTVRESAVLANEINDEQKARISRLKDDKTVKGKVHPFYILDSKRDESIEFCRFKIIKAFCMWLDQYTKYGRFKDFSMKLFSGNVSINDEEGEG